MDCAVTQKKKRSRAKCTSVPAKDSVFCRLVSVLKTCHVGKTTQSWRTASGTIHLYINISDKWLQGKGQWLSHYTNLSVVTFSPMNVAKIQHYFCFIFQVTNWFEKYRKWLYIFTSICTTCIQYFTSPVLFNFSHYRHMNTTNTPKDL